MVVREGPEGDVGLGEDVLREVVGGLRIGEKTQQERVDARLVGPVHDLEGLVAGLARECDELDVGDPAADLGRTSRRLARVAERGEREDPPARPASHRSRLLSAGARLNRIY